MMVSSAVENTERSFRIKIQYSQNIQKLLYKLHGDAVHEAIYASSPDDANENIIFSNSQYWNSIIGSKNRYILNYLKSDFCSRIVLFIGCSLKDEIDIKQVVDQCTGKYLPDSMRIIVRNESLLFSKKCSFLPMASAMYCSLTAMRAFTSTL